MKTIQKTIALSIAIFSASVSFGQLGLGATTQTAINATVNAATVVSATQSISASTLAATRGTLNIVATKATDIKASTITTFDASAKTTTGAVQTVKADLKNDLKENTDAGVKVDGSVIADGKTAGGTNNANASVKTETKVSVSKQ